MKNLAQLLAFILLFLSSSASAKSLEWQRIELEETINTKYATAIRGALKNNEFLVKSQVKYNDPGMPDFQDLNKADFKISDLPFDESKGDYIAFAKVGLEVPVVGKMHQEHQKKLKELYRYNESYDLFKNIQSVDVLITVSEQVGAEKLAIVKNIVKSLEFSVSGFTPTVEVKPGKIEATPEALATPEPKEEEIGLKDIMEFIGKFGNAIGLITAVALLGLLAFKLLKKWMEFMEKLKAMEEPKSEKEDEEQSPMAMEQKRDEDPLESEETIETESPSFERFERLLALNAKQAGILLKRWLKREDEEASMILTAVAQQLDPEGLEKLFEEINAQEREKWNTGINGYLDKESLDKANGLISEGVMKELVGGSFVDDHEIVDLILSMSSETVKSYILKDGPYGKMLANLLNPEVISEILEELSVEDMDKVISQSMDFKFSDLKENSEDFKKDLAEFCQTSGAKPFNNKLLQVISEVGADKETLLYKHMANECSRGELIAAARRAFPSDLVLKMPKGFLKMAMQNYPMEKKIGLLASLESAEREELMNSFLEEGSNAKEMISMELEAVMEDELQYKRVQAQSSSIWKEFLNYVREAVKGDEEYKGELDGLVAQWVDSLKEEATKAA